MPLTPQPPHDVTTDVAGGEADPAVATPLANMHQFPAQLIRRCLARAHDDQRAKRDAVEAFGNRTALPKDVSVALLNGHDRRAYLAPQTPFTGLATDRQ